MAKSKTKGKRYAVQRHIEVTGLHASQGNILDVPKFLSESNHRLYRQSRVYKCKISSLDALNAADNRVHVYVLRDTWMLQKAYQMAKDTFDKNTVEERSGMSPVNMARWQDFRINLTPSAGSSYTTLSPVARNNGSLNTVAFSNGEFVDSLVTREDSTDMSFGLFGLANSRWGIMDEYDRTADVDDDPANLVSGSNISAYSGLDNDNDDGSRNHLQTAGNSPPYDPNTLGGEVLFRKVATIGAKATQGSSNQKLTSGFFDAPLGFILLVNEGSNAAVPLELEVQSGDYKGVHGAGYIDTTKKFGHRRG